MDELVRDITFSIADRISVIAELGLIFLLFMIGLEIDLKKLSALVAPSA